MLNDPYILILDEPTAGLDPKERVRFRNLISAFSKDRIMILFSKRLTQLALAAGLPLSALLAFSTYQNKYASDSAGNEGTGRTAVEIDKAIAARYSETLSDENYCGWEHFLPPNFRRASGLIDLIYTGISPLLQF